MNSENVKSPYPVLREEKRKRILINLGYDPNIYKLSQPCKYGHQVEGLGLCLRLAVNSFCYECNKIKAREHYAKPEVKAERSRKDKQYRTMNAEAIKERRKSYREKQSYKDLQRVRSLKYVASKKAAPQIPYTSMELIKKLSIFNTECAYCSKKLDKTEPFGIIWDHVQALNNGGWDCIDNLVPCCRSCNSSKQDRFMITWYMKQDFYNPDKLKFIADHCNLEFIHGGGKKR